MEGSINELQEHQEWDGGLIKEDMIVLRNQLSVHHSLLNQQEIMWRQKCRVQQIKERDRDTKFFYRATIVHRYRNQIWILKNSEGQWTIEEDEIRQEIVQFFGSRWMMPMGGSTLLYHLLLVIWFQSKKIRSLFRLYQDKRFREWFGPWLNIRSQDRMVFLFFQVVLAYYLM